VASISTGDATGTRRFDAGVPAADASSYATSIATLATFRRFANRPGGVVRTGEVIKFLIDNRRYPNPRPPVYYINGKFTDGGTKPVSWVALHRQWAGKVLPDFDYTLKQFSKTAYFTTALAKREWISGRIQTFEDDGKIFFGVWFIEMDLISEEMLQFALQQLQRTFSVPEHPLHFVAYSTHQTTAKITTWLAKNDFVVHKLSDLLANVRFQSLNVGEAWGFVRMSPADPDNLEPNEIPVFKTLPLDLGVVAGTITTAFQDVASHVNIKAKQRNTPNLMLRDAEEIKRLESLDGKPIHLTVTVDGYTIKLSTAAVVRAKLEALLSSRKWQMPPADLEDEMVTFDDMCRKDQPIRCLQRSTRLGGKAAGLGFLAHPKVIGEGSKMHKRLGYRLTPMGFAVPIAAYKKFVDFNGARNPLFKSKLDRLMKSEVGVDGAKALTTTERRKLINEIQAMFLEAPFPPGMYARLADQLAHLQRSFAERYPGEKLNKLKIRSSANVEDIPQFNGAGLHNSFSAKINQSLPKDADAVCKLVRRVKKSGVKVSVKPPSVACAVKAAYASLWNLRAVRERTFRRFDHRGAYMGLAVSPSYKARKKSRRSKIAANSVLLTRVLNTSTVYGYQLSTQVGGNLVTNPDPGSLAELTTLTFQLASVPAPTVLQYAKPKADRPRLTKTILSNKTMRQIVAIARTIEEAYCRARPSYFVVNGKQRKCHQISNSQKKPSALDMELKIYESGQILIKQVREFDGR